MERPDVCPFLLLRRTGPRHTRRRPEALQRRPGAGFAGRAALGLFRYFRHVDVGRSFGRRLHLCGKSVLSRADRMAGLAVDGGRYRRGLFSDESDRRPVAAIRRALSGGCAHVVRRDGRQPGGDCARHRRHRLVRRANLFCFEGGRGAGHHALAERGDAAAWRHARPLAARLGKLPVHVAVPASDLPQRHGDDPQIHRFLRPCSLCGDVRVGDLGDFANRTVEPVVAASAAGRGLDTRPHGECRDADRRLFRRAVVEFRRLLTFRQGTRGDEARKLPRPADQFPGLFDHHRDRDRGHRGKCSARPSWTQSASSSGSAIP